MACERLRVMRRAALVRVPRFNGMHRFLPTLLRVVGEQVEEIEVSHRPRVHGVSKYGMWDRLRVCLRDAVAVRRLVIHGPTARTGVGTGGGTGVYK